ncbi:ABC transporter permease [Gracilibacillus alcaliphilus]|uniref:ABC transporter permease n=1 Tax=Gracilibacillus alcaliphilus TaxID=1401441 RepID=UPI00195E8EF8|nr:ABC transporter permease [Gracilibacillus alcaliphilus]MBM7676967.1 ABC-2 type transport system permease protein [Gracilibacillus alcaliphilus]
MSFSIKRLMAIFQKDLKDLYRNLYVLSTVLLPLVFAFIYGRMDEVPAEIQFFLVSLTLSMVGTFLQCAIIAEEKEKNTLRGLMLSPATLPEILAGKSLVTVVITIVTLLLCIRMAGFNPDHIILVIVGIVLSLIFFLALGTWLGLVTRSVLEASVYVLPIMMIFGMSNMFIGLKEDYAFLQVLEYTPGLQLVEIASLTDVSQSWKPLLIIFAWAAGAVILSVITFRKRSFD